MTPLHVQGLEKHYPGFSLTDMSFDLRPGMITGLIGRNGAGKTTTLRSILGFLHRDAGEIRFWDEELDEAKHRIGYVVLRGKCRYRQSEIDRLLADCTIVEDAATPTELKRNHTLRTGGNKPKGRRT